MHGAHNVKLTYNLYIQGDATEIFYVFLKLGFQSGIPIIIPRNESELLKE